MDQQQSVEKQLTCKSVLYITQLKGLFMCRICGVRLGFVFLMNLTYNFWKTSALPRGLLNMFVTCDVSGPDVEDFSKNGKKAAEAMSLSKDGKSAHHHLRDIVASVVGTSENEKA